MRTGGNIAIARTEKSKSSQFDIPPHPFNGVGINLTVFKQGNSGGVDRNVAAIADAEGLSFERTSSAQLQRVSDVQCDVAPFPRLGGGINCPFHIEDDRVGVKLQYPGVTRSHIPDRHLSAIADPQQRRVNRNPSSISTGGCRCAKKLLQSRRNLLSIAIDERCIIRSLGYSPDFDGFRGLDLDSSGIPSAKGARSNATAISQ